MAALPKILRALKLAPPTGVAIVAMGLTGAPEDAFVIQVIIIIIIIIIMDNSNCKDVYCRLSVCVLPGFQVHCSGALPPSLTHCPAEAPRACLNPLPYPRDVSMIYRYISRHRPHP